MHRPSHAGAPQFLWPQAVRYAAHQLNLWPSVAQPLVTPVSLWIGSPGVAADFRPPSVALVVLGGAGGAVAEGEGIGVVEAGGVGSGGVGGVGVEFTPVEDTTASSTGGPGGVGGGGADSGGAGAGGTGTMAPTPRTLRFLTCEQRLLRLEREEHERGGVTAAAGESRGGFMTTVAGAVAAVAGESRGGVTVALGQGRAKFPPAAAGAVTEKSGESGGVPLAAAGAAVAAAQEGRGGAKRGAAGAGVSLELHRSRYHADGLFHLVLRSRVPPPPVLPQPPKSPLTVLHDPLFDYLRASHPVVSCLLSALVSTLITTVACFASSHHLEYAAHLVSGPARSSSSGGAPVFPLEVLEDRQFELGFFAAAVPHLCTMLLAPEGDPDALDVPIPRNHAEAHDYGLHSLDFSTMFLSGSLHEQIWLHHPPGFTGSFPPGTQWQLHWLVYGLHKAPREGHDTLRTTLAALEFFLSTADPSLFDRHGRTPFFVHVYVDDLVFATLDRHALASEKEELQRRHTCNDVGELQCYLGLQITRDRAARTITLMQSHMVEQILTRSRFPFSKVQPTPLAVDHGLTAPTSDEPFESSSPYPELVGCLMYLMTCT
ncbi:unnamed protein product [Closterium sp. NIES-53]